MSEGKNWVFLITEQHRYQGLSYKSDIIVISGRIKALFLETIFFYISVYFWGIYGGQFT